VLLTHDHSNHGFNDAVRICREFDATSVGILN